MRRLLERSRDRLLYGGEGLACPCCGGCFRRFRSAGRPPRPNARCPACGSLERHRQQWLWLERRSDVFERPQRILHVAPEPVLFRRLSNVAGLEYVPIDKHEPGHSVPPGVARADLTALPFAAASFGSILCFHVLEHVPDDRRAIAEMRRVLRPDGWALIEVPLDLTREDAFEEPAARSAEQRLRAFGQADHVRIYGRDFPGRLAAESFTVEAVEASSFCTDEEIGRYALTRGRTAYLARPLSSGSGS